jgi:hypothetical protein
MKYLLGIIVLGILAAGLVLMWESGPDGVFSITDITQRETLLLTKKTKDPVHGLVINVSGNINGRAILSLLMNAKPYKTRQLRGAVDEQLAGDWYGDHAVIVYTPQ